MLQVNLIQKFYRPEPEGFVNECYDSDLKRMSKPPAAEAGSEPKPKIPARSEEVSVLVARVVPSIPTLSFLSSLSCNTPILQCHPQALQFIQGKKFAKTRTELTRQLYELFNREIFGAALSPSMECKWNMRLTKTSQILQKISNFPKIFQIFQKISNYPNFFKFSKKKKIQIFQKNYVSKFSRKFQTPPNFSKFSKKILNFPKKIHKLLKRFLGTEKKKANFYFTIKARNL